MKQLTCIASIWTAGFVAGFFACVMLAQSKANRETAIPEPETALRLRGSPFLRPIDPQLRGRGPVLIYGDGQFPNGAEGKNGLRVAL